MGQSRTLFQLCNSYCVADYCINCSISVYGGYGEAIQLCVFNDLRLFLPAIVSLCVIHTIPVNANELERLKKRFMKLDRYVTITETVLISRVHLAHCIMLVMVLGRLTEKNFSKFLKSRTIRLQGAWSLFSTKSRRHDDYPLHPFSWVSIQWRRNCRLPRIRWRAECIQ